MSKVLTRANIAEAIGAVEAYQTTCDGIYTSLQGTLSSLTAANWIGEGSEGCKYFFNGMVTEVLTEGITSMNNTLKEILTNVEQTLLDTLDPQLGEANRSPGT